MCCLVNCVFLSQDIYKEILAGHWSIFIIQMMQLKYAELQQGFHLLDNCNIVDDDNVISSYLKVF